MLGSWELMTGKSRAVGPYIYGHMEKTALLSACPFSKSSRFRVWPSCHLRRSSAVQDPIPDPKVIMKPEGRTLKTERIYRDMISNEVEISDS